MVAKLQFDPQPDFNNLLLSSIMDELNNLDKDLGNVILNFIQRKGIEKHEISDRIETFADALEEIFGPGSAVIERAIIENLKSRLELIRDVKIEERLFDFIITSIEQQVGRYKDIYSFKDRAEVVRYAFITCIKLLELRGRF
ncbi:MAG: hypothetical protein RMJ31_06440 [Nitrososphaerota archaeon]|nr:hypothetical protein [Nitrososphaerota archaeon]